jgi:hypothetical protein
MSNFLISNFLSLASVPPPKGLVQDSWRNMSSTAQDCLILLGVLALVTLPILLWAGLLRHRFRRHHHHHSHHHSHHSTDPATSAVPGDRAEGLSTPPDRGGSRRRRREHRPRNPTRAETGGLPVRHEPPPGPVP